MKSPLGRTALPCVLLAGTALCALAAAPAHAQATARQHRAPDANGVDLTWGDYLMRFTEGSIGAGEAELALVRTGVRTGTAENGHEWDGVLFVQDRSSGVEKNNVFLGPVVETFAGAASSPRGSVLSGGGGSYTYTRSDGTSIEFSDISASSGSGSNLCNGSADQVHCSLLPTSVSSPNGNTVSIEHDLRSYCTAVMVLDQEPNCTYYSRISRISNGYGYSIGFTYASNGGGTTAPPPADWFRRTGAAFYNSNVSAGTPQASVSYSYPSSGVTEVTDMGGNQWRFTGTVNGVTSIRRPGASSATTTIGYASGSNVSSVTNEGVTTGYSRSVSGSTATMTVTNALGQVSTIVSDLAVGRPTSATDPLGRTTSWQYDSHGRLTRTTAPEGNYVQLGYDSRGNVTQSQAVAKPGSGAAAITTSATYASSCSVDPACNSPLTTTDARGNITDYSYDSTHGGLLTVTAPAPASGAARPQTRYGYTLTNGEYRLTSVSQCQTGASCAGTADEVKSAIAYDSNGNVISASVGSGNGALTAATAMTYDAMGNLVTVDGPLSGSADTVR
ncbi:MAG TPA: RHS repeat domain-containing protein, partial [Allosphingosinicella sp.]